MKHKYKITIDQPLPSEDKIARHKDFGRILADYHNLTQPIYRKPLYKNPKAFIGLVLIMTIAFLVFWTVDEDDKEKAKQEEMEKLTTEIRMAPENSFLKPPVPTLALQPVRLQSDFAKPQKIQLPGGISVTVPADAFEDETGKPVTGEVEVSVRTLDQPAEMIAMGVPMQADSRLISPQFVLDVKATQHGRPLRLKPGKKLDVEQSVEPSFGKAQSLFTLDTQARVWKGDASALVKAQVRQGNVAAIVQEDGFGVVQHDENGKVIPQKRPSGDGSKEIKVVHFELGHLGVMCLGEASDLSGAVQQKMRFVNANKDTLRLLTVYSIPEGLNTVQFLWPKTTDFVFEVGLRPDITTTLVGFLPDGRIGIARGLRVLPASTAPIDYEMEISAAPIKDLNDLTQRLAVPDSH